MYLTWLKKSMKSKNWSTFCSKKSNRYFSISVLNQSLNLKMINSSLSVHNWLKLSKNKNSPFYHNSKKIKMFPDSSIKENCWIRLYVLYLNSVKFYLKKDNHQLIPISISMKHTILFNKAKKMKSNSKKKWFFMIFFRCL